MKNIAAKMLTKSATNPKLIRKMSNKLTGRK
jgi:hypothetical protein